MTAPRGDARVTVDGVVVQLGGRVEQDQVVTERDVQTPSWLARVLGALLRDVAALKRRWAPRKIDFEDRPVSTAGALIRLEHRLGGRVRYWVVDWSASTAPILRTDASTDANTLVLASYVAGTATIRVEESG